MLFLRILSFVPSVLSLRRAASTRAAPWATRILRWVPCGFEKLDGLTFIEILGFPDLDGFIMFHLFPSGWFRQVSYVCFAMWPRYMVRDPAQVIFGHGYCHQKVGLCWAILGFRGGTLRISWYIYTYKYIYIHNIYIYYIYLSGYIFFGWRSTKLVCKWVGCLVMSRGARKVQRAKRCWPPSNQTGMVDWVGQDSTWSLDIPWFYFGSCMECQVSLIPQHLHYISLLIIFIHAAYSIINLPFWDGFYSHAWYWWFMKTWLCHRHRPIAEPGAAGVPGALWVWPWDAGAAELAALRQLRAAGSAGALIARLLVGLVAAKSRGIFWFFDHCVFFLKNRFK